MRANLAACRSLYRLRVRCPRLEALAAPQCLGLRELFEDSFLAPSLRDLNLFGCRQLAGAMLGAALGGCTALRRLNLNGCWGVGALHLPQCPGLEALDVSGCRNLAALSAPSPVLSDLAAVACARLAEVTLAPARPMVRLALTNCGALREAHCGAAAGALQQQAAAAAGGGGGGRARRRGALNLSGCGALPPDARARLASLVAAG